MEDTIVQQWGAFGAVFLLILAPLGAFALHQTRALSSSNQARVDDAKAVANTVVSVIKDFSEAAREQVRSQTEQKLVSERVESVMERVEARIGALEARVGQAIAGRRASVDD